jgi:caffeoyl-CoA O-methyltransferase
VADAPKSFHLSPAVHEYIVAHGTPPDEIEQWLIGETKARVGDLSGMQIAPEQGAFMTVLTRLLGARSAVEVGTFTGYSSLCIARGLASGGTLLCCDISEEWTAIGIQAWEEVGLRDRIELRIAPALTTLRGLPQEADFDLAFIDADKTGYVDYWEELVPRVRPGGVLLVDNVLWSGRVADEGVADEDTVALRRFNNVVAADVRVEAVVLTAFDGLTIARKL